MDFADQCKGGFQMEPSPPKTKFFILTMKITSVLLLAFCLQVSARTVGQKVSVSLKNVRVQEVLREVIRQAGVSVLYDEDAFEGWKPVTVVVSNASVQEV
ncbi:MAG TPA: hypothetical protein VK616_05120, partial [Flavitalea sp.]|nr:hypothetical protein [Flavitalea sp.]